MKKIPTSIKKTIDELYDIRQEIKKLKSSDTELSTFIKVYMLERDLDEIESQSAVASIGIRPLPHIDPESYYESLDNDIDKLLASVTVRIDEDRNTGRLGARSFLGNEELKEIVTAEDIPVLSIKRINKTKQISAKKPSNIKIDFA